MIRSLLRLKEKQIKNRKDSSIYRDSGSASEKLINWTWSSLLWSERNTSGPGADRLCLGLLLINPQPSVSVVVVDDDGVAVVNSYRGL